MTQLPNGWIEATLGDLGDEVRGSETPIAGTVYELYSVPTFPTRKPEVLDGSEIGSSKRPVQLGDVLLCKINPRINRVWMVAEPLEPGRQQIASTEYLVLRTPLTDLSRYLVWYLRSPRFREWIKLSVEGATGSHTRAKSGPVLRQRVPLPPLNEQRRIVAAVEEQFSRLEAAEAMLDRARVKVDAMHVSVIDAVARAAIDRWSVQPIADVCAVITNGNTPPANKMTLESGDVPFIKVYNLTSNGSLDFSKKPTFIDRKTHDGQLRRSRLLPGDVLTNIVGPPLGKVAIVPETYPEWNTNQAVVAFRAHREMLEPRLLAVWLQAAPIMAPLLATAKATAGQFNLNLSACRRLLEVPIPPLDEQHRMLAEVERTLSITDSTAAAIDAAKRRSAALRRTILDRAFRGELVPQDPSDEAASVLLERVMHDPATVVAIKPLRRVRP
jgi:type I restriction enzyme S subunit